MSFVVGVSLGIVVGLPLAVVYLLAELGADLR